MPTIATLYPWLVLAACAVNLLNTLFAWESGRNSRGNGFSGPQALLSCVVTAAAIRHALQLIG